MDEVNGRRAAIYACDALLALAQNLATSAETLAAAESNPYRRAELLESAAILHHVPAHPARNFKEACRILSVSAGAAAGQRQLCGEPGRCR